MKKHIISAALALAACTASFAAGNANVTDLGAVTSAFKLLGANHQIVVSVVDDPKVQGVACYLSRAKTGGITGSLGIAEDTSDVSIACRQVGPIVIPAAIQNGEPMFKESRSLLFKHLNVVRMWDPQRRVLVYLAYSDKLIDGSPKNSISVVPVR